MLHNECKRAFDEGGRKHGVGNRGLIGLKLSKLSDGLVHHIRNSP